MTTVGDEGKMDDSMSAEDTSSSSQPTQQNSFDETPASYTLFPLVFAFITGMIGMYGIHQN
jgi:hypothetical protein